MKRLFGGRPASSPRIRVCMECGMPVAEHKEWCAVRRGELERERQGDASATRTDVTGRTS